MPKGQSPLLSCLAAAWGIMFYQVQVQLELEHVLPAEPWLAPVNHIRMITNYHGSIYYITDILCRESVGQTPSMYKSFVSWGLMISLLDMETINY